MSTTIDALTLTRRQNELRGEIRELADLNNDDSRKWTAEDEKRWKACNREYDDNQRLIEVERVQEKRSGTLYGREDRVGNHGGGTGIVEAPKHTGEFYRDVMSVRIIPVVRGASESFGNAVATMRGDGNDRRDEYEGLNLGRVLRALAVGCQDDQERRALAEGSDSAGGYTVPSVLGAQLVDLMRVKARVFQAGASLVPMGSDKTSFAKLLTDPVPGWRSELSSVATSDPTFGQVTFQPKSLGVLVRVSQELLEDSINVEQGLNNALAQSLANEVDRVCLVGTGASNEPSGITNWANGVNEHSMGANGAAVADFTPILDAIKLLQDDNVSTIGPAIMNPRTLRVFSGLEDSTGQNLRPPFSIANLPFLETSQVPIDQVQGSATDASSIYLGNWADLVVGMRSTLRVEILKERYADTLEIGFLAHLRCDVAAWHEQSLARIIGIIP